MSKPRRLNATAVALYVNAGVLLAILLVMVSRNGSGSFPQVLPMAYGQNQPPIAGGAGVFVMPAQFAVNSWGCYLLDVDSQTIVAYQYFPGEKQLRLTAARNYNYDRRLRNFNTGAPSPAEVQQLIEKERDVTRTVQPDAPDAPATQQP